MNPPRHNGKRPGVHFAPRDKETVVNEENAVQGNEPSADQAGTPPQVSQAVREVLHEKYDEDMRAQTTRGQRARWLTGASIAAGTLVSALLVRTARSSAPGGTRLFGGSRGVHVSGEARRVLDTFVADFERQVARQQQALGNLDVQVDELVSRRRRGGKSGRALWLLLGAALAAWRLSSGRGMTSTPDSLQASPPAAS